MLRVVIADDEERLVKLIQILADWPRLGMEVVGTACNGVDALALIGELQPDILITDIRMPGLDGLALISHAKEAAPALEVIIISGYAQFDYAQTAIQYGVGDYLLKPINKQALNTTLEKMGDRCRARQTTAQDMERLRLSTRDGRNKLRESLLTDLLNGRYAASDAAELQAAYCFTAQEDTHQVFLLKLDYDPDQFSIASLQIVYDKAMDLFRPILSGFCSDFLLECREACLYGVMNYPGRECADVRNRLRECLNQLVALQNLFGPVNCSLALGKAVPSPAGLTESLSNARAILPERLTEGTGRLLEGVSPSPALRESDLLARYVQDATRAIDVLDIAEGDSAVDALFAAASAIPGAHGWELLELVRGAGMMFVTRLGLEDREQALAAFSVRCGLCCRTADLFACLRGLQREQLTRAQARQRNQDGQPIRLAKQYIQKNYATPLTLEEVAAATGFSVNYFSTLFKKETGEGFAKYLARIRMEEAKSLLRETRYSVSEVCNRVGYGDTKHFTRTFRQETGITPGEFRKLYG